MQVDGLVLANCKVQLYAQEEKLFEMPVAQKVYTECIHSPQKS